MYKQLILLLCILLNSGIMVAQEKLNTNEGLVTFEASVRSFEEVKASTKNTKAILEIENGKLAVLIQVTSFAFKNSLMQEHFNENYIESTKYPNASFAGSIVDFDVDKLNTEPAEFIIEGDLTLHGKTNRVNTPVSISKINSKIILNTRFKISANEYDIQIPKLITKKIAENIQIDVNLEFEY